MLPELRFIRQLMRTTNRMKADKYLQSKHRKYKKIAVSVVAAVFLVLLYLIIFSFSEQDGDTSGSISGMIAEKCVEILCVLSGKNWSQQQMLAMAGHMEGPIRKCAHFMEYTCMAVLVYIIWRPWKPCNKRLYLLVILWVAVSAAGDEIHQLFVPGRCGSMSDVMLDTCGGIFGLWCCVAVEKIYCHKKEKKCMIEHCK